MSYGDLPLVGETGERHAWGVFGDHDEFGTLNRITAAHVRDAARLVEEGRVINVNLPVDQPGSLADERAPYRHHVDIHRFGRDDKLDDFYPQGSTQWDGLRHIRFREHGYFGGRQEDDLDASGVLGIDRWTERGVVGRGVLLDVARFAHDTGCPWAVDDSLPITPQMLDATAAHQGVEVRAGDIVMVRTGWLGWYLTLDDGARRNVGSARTMRCPGLESSRETTAWLWDHGVAAVATDNVAVESLPVDRDRGFLHHRLVALLGMILGELWHLDPLSADCAADGRYEGLLTSAPLALPRAAGAPANAYVVK